jgi:hypothetical protein
MNSLIYIDVILTCWLTYEFVRNHSEKINILKNTMIRVKKLVQKEI